MKKEKITEVTNVEFTPDKCILKNKNGDPSCFLSREEGKNIGLKKA